MFLAGGILPTYANAIMVQIPSGISFDNFRVGTTCYSGVRFGSDGVIYKMNNVGAWQSSGNSWLLDGNASDYYLKRVATGDALADDSGNLQQMNANLDFSILATFSSPSKSATIAFTICDDTGGASELVSQDMFLLAERS